MIPQMPSRSNNVLTKIVEECSSLPGVKTRAAGCGRIYPNNPDHPTDNGVLHLVIAQENGMLISTLEDFAKSTPHFSFECQYKPEGTYAITAHFDQYNKDRPFEEFLEQAHECREEHTAGWEKLLGDLRDYRRFYEGKKTTDGVPVMPDHPTTSQCIGLSHNL